MPMLSFAEAKNLYDNISILLPFGSSNIDQPHASYVRPRIRFIRELAENIFLTVTETTRTTPLFDSFFENNEYIEEYFQILSSAFSIAIGAGNCGEMAALVYTQFLSHSCPKEIINLQSTLEKKDENIHALVIFNRVPSLSTLDKPETWPAGTIVFDYWASQLYEIKEETPVSKTSLAYMGRIPGKEEDINIRLDTSMYKEISLEESKKIVTFLKAVVEFLEVLGKSYFTKIAASEKVNWVDMDVDNELARFISTLHQYAKLYEKTPLPSEVKYAKAEEIKATSPASSLRHDSPKRSRELSPSRQAFSERNRESHFRLFEKKPSTKRSNSPSRLEHNLGRK